MFFPNKIKGLYRDEIERKHHQGSVLCQRQERNQHMLEGHRKVNNDHSLTLKKFYIFKILIFRLLTNILTRFIFCFLIKSEITMNRKFIRTRESYSCTEKKEKNIDSFSYKIINDHSL